MGIALFIAEPTGVWRRRLRIYARDATPCPARTDGSYHEAVVPIEDTTVDPTASDGYVHIKADAGGIAADDPRWPTSCACGYVFTDEDVRQNRQVWHDDVFRAPDGSEFTDRDPPVGAMWRARWIPDRDGIESYIVQLPDGFSWITTQQSMKGECWNVTGTAPKITVTPSIFCRPNADPPGWHGFITDGVIVGVGGS